VELVRDNIWRIILRGVSRKHCMGLHALLMGRFAQTESTSPDELAIPRLVPSKAINDSIQEAQRSAVLDCRDPIKLLAIYENLRRNVSFKLPLM